MQQGAKSRRIAFLAVVMTVVVVAVTGIAITILYRTAFEEQRARLVELAQSQARLIEAVARYEFRRGNSRPQAIESTVGQVRDAHRYYKGFGETGEFTLARIEGDEISFLLSHRHADLDSPKPVPLNSALAEPMRRALSGKSGTSIGPDYRGINVLAAFEPVALLDFGIVAKIDLAEIRAPFIAAGAVVAVIAALMIVAGIFIFFEVGTPLVRRLQLSEERFRQSFEESQLGMAIVGLDRRIFHANRQLCDMLGYTNEELTSMTVPEITHPDEHAANLADRRKLIDHPGSSFQLEKRLVHKDGRTVWTMLHTALAHDAAGRPLHFVSQIEDITGKKRTEEALRESETRLRLIADNLPVHISYVDADLRYRFVNAAYESTFGLPVEEILGKTIKELAGEMADRNLEPYVNRAFTGEIVRFDIDLQYGDGGEIRTRRGIGIPRQDADGKVDGIYFLSEDVTDRKQAEADLVRTKQEAEAANRTKTEFLANMSHELRTPLNAIIGFSDALRNGLFGAFANERQEEYIDAIHDSGIHLLDIINDILDVSTIESGNLDLHMEKLNLATTAQSAIRMVGPRAEIGGVSITNKINGVAPDIIADKLRMMQILVNLLSNAVKFTPAGGSIVLDADFTANGTLDITVTDTGIGMNGDDLAKAMTTFGQADNSLAREYEGTGLGLPLTKGLIEAHGGQLSIESALDAGTTVTISLPSDCVARP